MHSLDDLITEAKRELGMRLHVYPKRVTAKFMTQQAADKQISLQQDILATLQALALAEKPLPLFPKETPHD